MMVTCKEDLINTYIENDHGELRDLYVSALGRFGVDTSESDEHFLIYEPDDYPHMDTAGFGWNNYNNSRRLTLSDLKQCTTETPEESEALDAITQVDSEEWKNGDECRHKDHDDCNLVFIGMSVIEPTSKCHVEYFDGEYVNSYYLPVDELTKPETPQQSEERDRLEAIEAMCNEVDRLPHGEAFAAMATLYDLGYRKGIK